MNRRLLVCIMITIMFIPLTALGASDVWNFSREVTTTGSYEYTEVFLDTELYKNSRLDMGDLRVVDGSGQFVPYYMAGASDPDIDVSPYMRSTKLKFDVSTLDKVTTVIIDNPYQLKINRLRFDISGNYEREFDLEGVDGSTVYGLSKGRLAHIDVNGETESETDIDLNPENGGRSSRFRLQINNQDDLPLDLINITGFYYIDKIVFLQEPGATYQLYYGSETAEKSYYDIEMYKASIEKGPRNQGIMGPQQRFEDAHKWYMLNTHKLLIILISLAAVVLLVIIGRKLLSKKAEEENL
ncbi:MAG: hypothetical protein ACM3PP_04395 [Candidatus Saccharibacteria bacterium]